MTDSYIFNLELLNSYMQSTSKDKNGKHIIVETLDPSDASGSHIGSMYLCPSPTDAVFDKAADCSDNTVPKTVVSVIKIPAEQNNSTVLPVYDVELPEEPLRLPLKAVPMTSRNPVSTIPLHSLFTEGASEVKDEFTRYEG